MPKYASALLLTLFSLQVMAHGACYQAVSNPVLKLFQGVKGENLELLCHELENEKMYDREGLFYSMALGISNFVGIGGFFGLGASAFSSMDSNPWQREFKNKILEINKNPDRLARIRAVYLLVSQAQGFYDTETAGLRTDIQEGWVVGALRPENILNSAHKYGTAGICRQFAALMYWSLLQVARSEGSVNEALGENDFSLSYVTGEVPWDDKMIGHAWIRVHLPQRLADGGLAFEDFDLDTTFYPGNFVPLIPRRTGLARSDRLDLISQCRQLQECLVK